MLLLNIVSSISINTIIQLILVLIQSVTESYYIWALLTLKKMFGEENLLVYPKVVVTDKKRALILASQIIFSQINLMLYSWQIRKNVLKTYKNYLETKEI